MKRISTFDKKENIFLVLFAIFLFSESNVAAQPSPDGQTNGFASPEILPPSPNSASLGKYSGIQPGLSSGTMQKSVPLLTFSTSRLTVPISLNYTTNGIKVDEIASRVGMSWNLEAGGIITRTVYGEVDEFSHRITDVPSFNPPTRAYVDFLEKLCGPFGSAPYETSKYWDGEPDIFSFNFNGYSGRFILDENLVPLQLSNNGLQIVRNGDSGYTITTPEGIQYIFGGAGAIETLRKYTVGLECGRQYPENTATAYYMRKIVHPLGDTILFNYSAVNYLYKQGINANLANRDPTVMPGACPGGDSYTPPNTNVSCLTVYETNSPLLNQIESSGAGNITFEYVNRQDVDDKLLKTIRVFQPGKSNPYRSVRMDYLEHEAVVNTVLSPLVGGDNSLKFRPFLLNVNIEDNQGNTKQKYLFSYYTLNKLPPRLSYAQDYYGYPNGKDNNTFYPRPRGTSARTYLPEATADRKPDPSFISAGLLSKIIYPTGGVDSIIYENNTVWDIVNTDPVTANLSVGVDGTEGFGTGIRTSDPVLITHSQQAHLYMNFSHRDPNYIPEPDYIGWVEVLRNGSVIFSQHLNVNQTINTEIGLTAGDTYQIRATASVGPEVRCAATLSYELAPSQVTHQNVISAGARVAKVITKEGSGQVSGIKAYRYTSLADPDMSTGTGIADPTYSYLGYKSFFSPCGASGFCQVREFRFYTCSSNSIYNLFLFGGIPVSYSYVIEEEQGETNNGGTEYGFKVVPDIQGNVMIGEFTGGPVTSNGNLNGKEISRYVFRRSGATIIPVKKVFTTYKDDTRFNNEIKAYVATRNYQWSCTQSSLPMNEEMESYNFMVYSHHMRWIYPDTVKTQVYAEDGVNYTETVEAFFYDNPINSLLSRSILTKSDGSKEVNYTSYPDDYASGSTFIDNMRSGHVTGLPIEQVKYKEVGATRTILSGTLTKYQTGGKGLVDEVQQLETTSPIALSTFRFSNRAAGVLPPSGTATALLPFSGYKPRLKYDDYDNKGNLLQYTQKLSATLNGPSTVYLWSYNKQYPIAEIKNADYATVASVLGGTSAVENFSNQMPDSAQVRLFLAPLRTSALLEEAAMTTYTYDPLVGMTSKTDEKGAVTYYEYDSFQRLKAAKDQEGKIIETYDYHYKQP